MSDIIEQDVEEKQGEELPVLTAQRFLNIFRQMHIFSDRKRKQFDSEILSLSSDVIKALSSLPGSSLLLDHIDELKGISAEDSLLNEAKKKAHQESRKNAEVEEQPTENKIVAPVLNPQAQTPIPFPVFDNSFSDNLTTALSLALEKLESKHNHEMSELMSNVMETLKVVADKKDSPVSVQTIPVEGNIDTQSIAELVKDVMSAQTQMFSQAVGEQTKAIADMLSESLKNQKPYTIEKDIMNAQTQMISQAVGEQTKAIAEMLRESLQNQKPYIIEKVTHESHPVVYEQTKNEHVTKSEEPIIKQEEPATYDAQDLSEEIAPTIEENYDSSAFTTPAIEENYDSITAPSNEENSQDELLNLLSARDEAPVQENKKKKKNKKKKNKSDNEDDITSIAAITDKPEKEVHMAAAPTVVLDDIKSPIDESENTAETASDDEWSWDKLDDIQASIEKDAQDRAYMAEAEQFEPEPEPEFEPEPEPEPEPESTPAYQETEEENPIRGMVNELIDLDDDNKSSTGSDSIVNFFDEPVEIDALPQEENAEFAQEVAPAQEEIEEFAQEDAPVQEELSPEEEADYNYWENELINASTDDASTNENEAFSAEQKENYEQDYSEPMNIDEQSTDEDYSFDASDFSTDNEQTSDMNSADEEANSEDEGEWEWEYEEVPDNEESSEEGGDDWEWEYEEVPADGENGEMASGNEWEWEYEEENDNDNNKK